MRMRATISLAPAALAALTMAGMGFAGEGNRALGEYLSSECVTCHQITGQYEGIPSIVGWPEATFVEIMDEYRAKRRSNPIMQTIAGRLSAQEVASLAAYFGSLSHKPSK
jgi:cytochrome c553